jgi:hypothetical protein
MDTAVFPRGFGFAFATIMVDCFANFYYIRTFRYNTAANAVQSLREFVLDGKLKPDAIYTDRKFFIFPNQQNSVHI